MSKTDTVNGVSDAQAQINEILQELEVVTGLRVKRISLDGIDLTPIGSPTRKVLRTVSIDLDMRVEESWDGQ